MTESYDGQLIASRIRRRLWMGTSCHHHLSWLPRPAAKRGGRGAFDLCLPI